MSAFVESANMVSENVLARLWTVVWQWTLIAIVLAAVILWLRRAQPAVRFWLWNLLLLKLILMPFWMIAVETAAPAEPSTTRTRAETPAAAANSNSDASTSAGIRPDTRRNTSDVASKTIAEPDAAETPMQSASVAWPVWMIVVWSMLVAVQLLRTLRQRTQLRRFLNLALPADEGVVECVATIAGEFDLRRAPRVLMTARDCSPFVCGFRRPLLVLPASLPESLSAASFRQVVLHELAHLKRRDLLWCWLSELVRIAFWFHPLVHWICRRIHLERELACDQVAMFLSECGAGSYAQTLVDVVTRADDLQRTARGAGSARLLTIHP